MEEILEENIEKNQEDKVDQPIEIRLYFETHRKSDGTWTHPQAQENYVSNFILLIFNDILF